MIFYLLIIAFLFLFPAGISISGFNKSCFSKDTGNVVKGVFILLIIASHYFNAYSELQNTLLDGWYRGVKSWIGQFVVVMFLFYSGFGVMSSVLNKGERYVKAMPVNRIARTFAVYEIAELLFIAVLFLLGIKCSAKSVIGALLTWETIGCDNWYVFDILALYFLTWISFTLCSNRNYSALLTAALTVFLILFLRLAGKESWWYDTLAAYPLGMFFALYADRIMQLFFKNRNWLVAMAFAVSALVLLDGLRWRSIFFHEFSALLFASAIVLLTMKIEPHNGILRFCGENLFGIFLMHRIPMAVLSELGVELRGYLWFAVCLLLALGLGWLFELIVVRNVNKLFDRKRT